MKLTPWMLTVATFCMVAAITVSYFFKNSTAVVQPAPRLASQPGWILPPASIGTNLSPTISQAPLQSPPAPDVAVQDSQVSQVFDKQPETYVPESSTDIVDAENQEPVPVPVQLDPPLLRIDIDDEPIDPLFGDSEHDTHEHNKSTTITGEPVQPGFVTQQFRSTERTDVRFVNGEAFPERVAQDQSKSMN
ncbi:MAG: hypothetical protein AB8G99_27300 [Planctomycetaceae bacterium]